MSELMSLEDERGELEEMVTDVHDFLINSDLEGEYKEYLNGRVVYKYLEDWCVDNMCLDTACMVKSALDGSDKFYVDESLKAEILGKFRAMRGEPSIIYITTLLTGLFSCSAIWDSILKGQVSEKSFVLFVCISISVVLLFLSKMEVKESLERRRIRKILGDDFDRVGLLEQLRYKSEILAGFLQDKLPELKSSLAAEIKSFPEVDEIIVGVKKLALEEKKATLAIAAEL